MADVAKALAITEVIRLPPRRRWFEQPRQSAGSVFGLAINAIESRKKPTVPVEQRIIAVTRRKVSGTTRSDDGRDCRDTFLGLGNTCRKLGVSFWDYLGSRLGAAVAHAIPPLPDLVAARCRV